MIIIVADGDEGSFRNAFSTLDWKKKMKENKIK